MHLGMLAMWWLAVQKQFGRAEEALVEAVPYAGQISRRFEASVYAQLCSAQARCGPLQCSVLLKSVWFAADSSRNCALLRLDPLQCPPIAGSSALTFLDRQQVVHRALAAASAGDAYS